MNQQGNNKNTRLPDFLVVGAAKSATSSLHFCLDQHPQIAMASQKESWFFSFYNSPPDYTSPGILSDVIYELEPYLRLYDGAGDDQLRGDACPSYLYTYEDTIRNIRQLYSPESLRKLKIIISLREPVSRARSQYYTFTRKAQEPLSFERAVCQTTIDQRMQQNWNIFYDYLGFGMYAKQVEAFQQAFGKDRVHVLLYEDVHADMREVCRGIFEFLGVDSDFVVDGQHKYNAITGEPRMKWIMAGLFSQNRFKRRLAAMIPKRMRMRIALSVFQVLAQRKTLDVDTHKRISELFAEDISRLEPLIERDLGPWRDPT